MKLKKLAELLGVELPEKKEILQPVPTAYRFGKNTAHGIWCYNQAKETYDNLDIPIERLLSEAKITKTIRRSRAGQALFLEVEAIILEDAYPRIAHAIATAYVKGELKEER